MGEGDTDGFSVQAAAERTGLSVHTLRYYERAGLIPSVGRGKTSGHRRYTLDDLRAVEFLKKMRATGMTIREMARYVALYRGGDATLGERREMLEAQGAVVRARIAELQESLAVIEYKIASYACVKVDMGSRQPEEKRK